MTLNESFKTKMKDLLGNSSQSFFDSLDKPSKKAITVNFSRISTDDFAKLADFKTTSIKKVDNGFLVENLKFSSHKLSHMGIIYSQEPSSMYPIQMLDIKPNDIILDLCAAPGGKSIQILEKLNNTGLLISNEIVYNRAKVLYENINRMGFTNSVITCNSPQDFENTDLKFDKILVDAPCGGEGMIRKDGFDINSYNAQSIDTNASRQLSILNSIKGLLKEGGILVYSTCTYDIRENEGVIAKFLQENPNFEILPCDNLKDVTTMGVKINNTNTDYTLRRYPHLFEGEGQFMAKLRKATSDNSDNDCYSSKLDDFQAKGFTTLYRKEKEQIIRELKNIVNLDGFNFSKRNNSIFVMPEIHLDYEGLNILSIGTLLGTIDKNGIKISHEFYHSFGNRFQNSIELDNEQIYNYLKGYEIELDSNQQLAGICVVTHNNIAIGGGKITGNKLKNYYPKQLRIN